MPTKFSPTTLIGWLKAICVIPLLAYVFFRLFTDPSFDAVKIGVEMVAVAGIINTLLSTINGHYVADADAVQPALKTNATGPDARIVALLFLAGLGASFGFAGCAELTSTTSAATSAAVGRVRKFNDGVKLDLASPQGKQFLASLATDALTITAAALSEGTNLQADVAASNALGGTLEAYSTLPTTSAQLAQIARAGAGAGKVATSAAPGVVALIDEAKKTGADPTAIVQAVASGVYAAAGVQPAPSPIPAAAR